MQYDDTVGVSVGGGALLDQDLVRKYNALVRAEESEVTSAALLDFVDFGGDGAF